MFDPNTQSIEFHLKDLESQMQPRRKEFGKRNDHFAGLVSLISIVGVIVSAAIFVPLA